MSRKYTAQEMRDMADQILITDDDWYEDAGHMLRQAADELEREATREKSSQVGNAAKMREALLLALVFANGMYNTTNSDVYLKFTETIEEALSSPPRNCDVGTAEEQTRRFVDFCYRSEACTSCQIAPEEGTDCILAWAQMPYKKGDEK